MMRRKSLAVSLTLYSVTMILILFLVFAGALYELLTSSLQRQDQNTIRDRAETIHSLLEREAGDRPLLRYRVEREWAARRFERIYVRVLNEQGAVATETPAVVLPDQIFASVAPTGEDNVIKTVSLDSGTFTVGRFQIITSDAQRFNLQIAIDATNEARLVKTFFRQSLPLVLIFVLIGCLVLSRVIVRQALQPVEDISRSAANVNSESLKERIDVSSLPSELHELAQTLNKMLDRLEDSFARLSRFSEDISHELRTPVNNMMGAFSVTLGRHRTVDEYEAALGSGIEDCERIKRIIESLLFISKAQDPAREIPREPIRVSEQIEEILGFYQALAQEAGIELEADVRTDAVIYAELTLFQRAIGNLLTNAIRHSEKNSKVIVRVERGEKQMVISVIDSGHGIAPEAMSRIGQRFFRVDPSRSKSSGGTGLGLSIVKGIAQLHHGSFDIQSVLNQGATVQLGFPLPPANPESASN